MMGACASVTSRSTRPCTSRAPAACAPSCGWKRPCAPDAPAASPAPHWPEKPEPRGKSWIQGATISLRPPEADDRAVPGHWEGDLVIGAGGRSALITLVERTSRFVLISRLGTRHDSATVTDALQTMVADLPRAVYSTITWDQGAEMAQHAAFTAITGIPVYFADPHSPWQRPTNENTNGLIREYFPKGTSFTDVTDAQVQAVQDQLNRRPREVLNGQTPTEILDTIINGATTT